MTDTDLLSPGTDTPAEKKPHHFSKAGRELKELAKEAENTHIVSMAPTDSTKTKVETLLPDLLIDPTATYEFELLKSGLRKDTLPNECTIFDPIEKRQRVLRYISFEQSIFKEEQSEMISIPYKPIVFECPQWALSQGVKPILRVKGTDKNLIMYLLLRNDCEGSPTAVNERRSKPKYRMIDKEKISADRLNKAKTKLKAEALAESMSEEDMIPFAYVLGIDYKLRSSEMRLQFIEKAGQNPAHFLQKVQDPLNYRKYIIKKGLDQNIITTGMLPNQLYWVTDKSKVTDIPPDKDQLDYLTGWSLNEQGKKFFSVLEKIVK